MNPDWKSVPIPDRMVHLPLDRRGYPVPDVVQWSADGKPLFTANDRTKVHEHISRSACGICGDEIETGQFHFLGGPMSAFHPHGAYIDGPVHVECGTYALRVCPYLAMPRFLKRADPAKLLSQLPEGMIGVDMTMLDGKPDCFVMIRCLSFNIGFPLDEMSRFTPLGDPFADPDSLSTRMLDYQCWVDGVQIKDERRAMSIIKASIAKFSDQIPKGPTKL